MAQQHFYYALVKNIFIIFQKLLKEINLNGSYLSPIISMWVESYLFFKYNQQTNQPIPTNQKDGKSKKIGKFVIVRLVQVSQRLLNVMTSLVYVHWYILNRYKQKVCCFCVISKKIYCHKKSCMKIKSSDSTIYEIVLNVTSTNQLFFQSCECFPKNMFFLRFKNLLVFCKILLFLLWQMILKPKWISLKKI